MRIKSAFVAAALALLLTGAAAPEKAKQINGPGDLPPVAFPLERKPSELATEAGPPLARFATSVEVYVRDVLAEGKLADPGVRSQLLSLLRSAMLLNRRWSDALAISNQIRNLQVKEGSRLADGLVLDAFARAASSAPADGLHAAFEAELRRSVASIPPGLAEDAIKGIYGDNYIAAKNIILGELQAALDPGAAAQGMQLDLPSARKVLESALQLRDMLGLTDIVVEVLGERLRSDTATHPDHWSERLVSIPRDEISKYVIIGIWDTGLDPAVFGSALWRNPAERLNGRDDEANGFIDDIHGFAFDETRRPATGNLAPRPSESEAEYEELVRIMQGRADVAAAKDTASARYFRDVLRTRSPEALAKLALQINRMRVYIHGTGTGSVAAGGNPGAVLMNGRYFYRVEQVTPPIDEADAKARARYARKAVQYFRANGARVVNMSFRITEPSIEASLASIEPDPKRRRERARAIFETIAESFEDAIRSAPEILFVTAAGNENESIETVRSAPAGLELPNLVTVGAVNRALRTTDFSSYGESVDIYANGDEVNAKIPGGHVLAFSGTSSAAPFVSSLAGKLLAICPTLTVEAVRQLIEGTATDESGLLVLNPRAAVEKLRSHAWARRCQGAKGAREKPA